MEPHRDVITNRSQVQIYQVVMGDAAGQPTWSLLRGTKNLKDNRLPPRGMKAAGASAAHIASQGVDGDANFHRRANGRDEVTYRIALAGTRGAGGGGRAALPICAALVCGAAAQFHRPRRARICAALHRDGPAPGAGAGLAEQI